MLSACCWRLSHTRCRFEFWSFECCPRYWHSQPGCIRRGSSWAAGCGNFSPRSNTCADLSQSMWNSFLFPSEGSFIFGGGSILRSLNIRWTNPVGKFQTYPETFEGQTQSKIFQPCCFCSGSSGAGGAGGSRSRCCFWDTAIFSTRSLGFA